MNGAWAVRAAGKRPPAGPSPSSFGRARTGAPRVPLTTPRQLRSNPQLFVIRLSLPPRIGYPCQGPRPFRSWRPSRGDAEMSRDLPAPPRAAERSWPSPIYLLFGGAGAVALAALVGAFGAPSLTPVQVGLLLAA